MKRGDIYYININYQEPDIEKKAGRPAVIVSNNNIINTSKTVNVVYLTTNPDRDLSTNVLTRADEKNSTILCDRIFNINKERVGNYLCTLTDKELQQLDIALAISTGIDLGAVQVMREPTEEEMAEIRERARAEARVEMMATIEQRKEEPAQIIENPEKPQKPKEEKQKADPDAQAIKTKTERDLYKKFSEELLEILKGGAKA